MRLRRWAVVASAVAASVAVGGYGAASGSTRGSAPGKHAARGPRPLRGPADSIADFLAGLAKEPAKNFLMEQFGLPTTASQLKEISSKIDALSKQLSATEARLSQQIAQLELQGRLDYLKDQAANLDSMYSDYLVPLVDSLVKVKDAQEKKPRDQAAIDTAVADYNTHKSEFLSYANSIQVTTLAKKIHDRLQPSDGRGVLRQYGALIMAKHRILTLGDSERVAALYKFLEEYQAVATWMSVERAFAVGGTSLGTVKRILDDFFAWQKHQRDPSASNGLLPPIPAGVAIDRGPDSSTQSYSTMQKPMFTPVSGSYAYAPWATPAWKPPAPPTVPAAVASANGAKLKGFSGWRVPSGDQLYGFFSGVSTRISSSIAGYIRSIFGEIAIPRPWIWTSDTMAQRYCYTKTNKKVHCENRTAYRGVSTSDLNSDAHPRYNGFVKLESLYREAQGALLVARDTGSQEYL